MPILKRSQRSRDNISIFLTLYSMVWYWRISRAMPILYYWPKLLARLLILLFSISLLSFYRLVLWGWGHKTDKGTADLIRALPSLAFPITFNNKKTINVCCTHNLQQKNVEYSMYICTDMNSEEFLTF